MRKTITLFTLLAFACFAARASFVPVALTGFNEDAIANGSGPIASSVSANLNSTYQGIDADHYVFVAQDYQDPNGNSPTHYLPTGGLLTSTLTSGLTFQLADYSANNSLYLPAVGDSDTLAFVTPASAGSVYIIGLSTAGSSEFDVTVIFSDGSTQVFANNEFADWYGTPPPISIPGIGRASVADGSIDPDVTDQNPHFFELGFTLDPSNFSKNITGVKIKKTDPTGNDEGYLLVMGVTINTVCSGTPTPGTVAASQTAGCQEYFPVLGLSSGATNDGGMAYQWQTSTDGVSWSNVNNATNSNYTADVSADVYFRDSMTCLNTGGGEAVTPGQEFTFTTPVPVPAVLPYFQGFENWMGTCYAHDRPDTSWILDPIYGNGSWRRDDQGSDAGWDYPTDGAYTPASTELAHSARFHTTDAEYGTFNMNLYLDFSATGTKSITFDYLNKDTYTFGPSKLFVNISGDSGQTWTTLGTLNNNTGGWVKESFLTDVVSPHAILQFQASDDYDYGDMGIDSVSVVLLPACSGTPDPGTIAATQVSGCSEYTSTLSATASASISGITYQWLSSTDGITYAPLNNATNATYSADVTANTWYEVTVTCTASTQSATSAPLELQLVTPVGHPATLPYFQGFESWIGTCYNYDRPDTSWVLTPVYGNPSWRRDDQGTDAGWTFPQDYYNYNPAFTEGNHSARFHSGYTSPAGTEGDMDLHADLSSPDSKELDFDYINGDGYDYMKVELSVDSGATWTLLDSIGIYTYSWVPYHVSITATAPDAIIRFAAFSDYGGTDIGIDSVSLFVQTPCTGVPVAGNTNTTQQSGCSEYFPTLSLDVDNTTGDLTYQWFTSTDGITYTPITAATNATYQADITQNTFFYCQKTCTTSGSSDTSNHIEEILTQPMPVYAALPYFQGFENWMGTCYNYDRPDNSWILFPNYGDASWRRDDQGADAGWDGLSYGMYSPASTELLHSARFHSSSNYQMTGDMDMYVDLGSSGTKEIAFDYINPDEETGIYGSTLTVSISTDSGSTFTQLGQYGDMTNNWTPEILTTTLTGQAIVRFEGFGSYAGTDMGIDSVSVSVLPPCDGMPTAGTFSNTQSLGCIPYLDTMTVDAPVYASGISYQWQSSTDGSTWTTIANATDYSYITPSTIAANTYYRFYVKCATSSDSAFSDTTELMYTPEVVTTATLPYFTSFESWVGGACYAYDRPDSNWIETPPSGNASWRRNDQGSDAGWANTGSGTYTPVYTDGSYSARFHAYSAGYGNTGSMDLHIDLSAPGTKEINFDGINTTSNDLDLQLSEDGGTTWTDLGFATSSTTWAHQFYTTNSVAPNAIIRLIANVSAGTPFGHHDVGVDSFSVSVLPSCTGTPTAGTFTASQTTGCVAYESNLSVDNPIVLTGISYQWQSSTDGTTWSNVTGATSTTYGTDVTATVYYRFYVKCAVSGDSDFSASTELSLVPEVAGTATLPYFQGFENWTGNCTPTDRPDTNWISNPTTGNNAWARDDQGDNALWDLSYGGMYDPPSTELDHSARFHSYEAYGSLGDLDLHVNLNYPGTKTILFDYNNDDGNDNLSLQLSEDGGNTFNTIATIQSGDYTGVYGWQPQSFTTTSVAANAILRFEATGDGGYTDIGMDSLLITAPTCDTVTNIAVSGITNTNAVATWDASGSAGYEVVVNTTAGDPSTAPGTTTNSYIANGLTPGTTYYLHVRDSCGPGLFSAWTTVSFLTTGNSCDSINGLAVSNLVDTGATISWTAVAGTAGYEYLIGNTSTAPSAGTGTATNSVTTTTLAPSTLYYVFVRDSCGPNSFSPWDTLSFTTPQSSQGIASVNGNFNVDAYPNPAKDIVTVRAYGQKGANRKASLTDVAGRLIEEENMTTDRVDFNMANLASGIYLIRYEDDDHTRVIKLNKQ